MSPCKTWCGQREARPGQGTCMSKYRNGHMQLDIFREAGLTDTKGIWGKEREIHVLGRMDQITKGSETEAGKDGKHHYCVIWRLCGHHVVESRFWPWCA